MTRSVISQQRLFIIDRLPVISTNSNFASRKQDDRPYQQVWANEMPVFQGNRSICGCGPRSATNSIEALHGPFAHRPPAGYFTSKAFDNPLIRISKIGSFVGVRFQVEQDWSRFVRRIFHLARPTVITEEQLPLIFDHPSIKQGGFGVMDVRDIMGEGFPKKRISSDLLSTLQSRQQIEPRQIAWAGCIRSRQYRWHDIDTAA